ncbi:phosphosulfolactate synthase [Desulfohalotomaculum tongense]|uniref:phosphosulfolactate synthase n=1 Tax=Desulforadius tongensis TaxID=1216062 RepID=UPI0019564944|nr:phosphosulfolactate synthase [Desulforadius tongensis]MBM7855133.1 phosphosulfolactate synthase [Desulforadius tongensis]
MAQRHSGSNWMSILKFPLGSRTSKPRKSGLTMVIDKGLGLGETRDLLNLAGDYIDYLKLGFGTSAFYATEILEEKINLVRSYNVDIYPGGTFLEVAILQDKLEEYLNMVKQLGFTAVEISDGTITFDSTMRANAINMAAEKGLIVLSEVGKKDTERRAPLSQLIKQVLSDLKYGAQKVIVEGRESGKGVGLYDSTGKIIQTEMEELVSALPDPSVLIWEAPLKDQQQDLILRFGPNVNFGNINAHEVLAVEALRVGLRADTLKSVCD